MVAERTALAAAEDRNVKKRKTAAALRTDLQPQKAENVLLQELDQERRELTAALKGRALKVCVGSMMDPYLLYFTLEYSCQAG